MLEIIAHRGLWQDTKNPNDKSAQNTLKAFERAFEGGFGVETDLRDFAGQIVISHDIATPKAPPLREFLHAAFHSTARPKHQGRRLASPVKRCFERFWGRVFCL